MLSATIDVNGVACATDPTLEHRLPQNMPLRDPILLSDRAILRCWPPATPKRFTSGGYLGPSIGHNKTTHRGRVEPDLPGG